ncbi:hypothetical protein [Xanthomonas fragariae]|uniref:hypothetical protein n=1 Tax=Xanthomonas fragariae TaxID=48664 RepID=UPI001F48ACC9|nr:hypothetical protein [Xanthomonas fragariae]
MLNFQAWKIAAFEQHSKFTRYAMNCSEVPRRNDFMVGGLARPVLETGMYHV